MTDAQAKRAPERPDILVIGAGSAGLSVAAAAAMLKAEVVLVERGAMGGDCLNTGCVPSKALIAAAAQAAAHRHAGAFGLASRPPAIDDEGVFAHVHRAIAAIAPHDSRARFESLGVKVVEGEARFLDARTVAVGDRRFRPWRVVLAVGARPAVPPIPGLQELRFHTNETIFGLKRIPGRLCVLGGGPIGLELAQAFARLGAAVTVVEMAEILPGMDPDLRAMLREALAGEGITLHEGARAEAVAAGDDGIRVTVAFGDGTRSALACDELLVATGRRPDLAALALERAGIATTKSGFIAVDRGLRTTNPRVYALGDCTPSPQFTHAAGYAAGILLRRLLTGWPAKADFRWIPKVIYTDPPVAALGLSEAEARARYGGRVRVLRESFAGLDRAVCDGRGQGVAKLILAAGRPVGVSIIGPLAGEIIAPWVDVLAGRRSLADLAGGVWPYPSYGELAKKLAAAALRSRLERRWLAGLLRGWWRVRRWF